MIGLDLERPPRFTAGRTIAAIVGVIAVAVGWGMVAQATEGLEVSTTSVGTTPVTLLVPEGATSVPGVVVAHGFAGSSELMRSFGLAFADAGFVVALPDLAGHGANRTGIGEAVLAEEILATVELLAAHPAVDPARLALVGHSMGSGAVLEAGIARPDLVRAVVAVSPTDADVTASLPPDLLLLPGEREPRFVSNAQDLLERAGGPVARGGEAPARDLVVVPGVEHVSILFSPVAHDAAVSWVAASVDASEVVPPERVPLLAWWGLALLGVLVGWRAVAPVVLTHEHLEVVRGRPLAGLLTGGVAATLVLAGVDAFLDLGRFGGMLVAPTLVLWFLVAGGIWSAMGARPGPVVGRDPLWGVLLLGLLVGAFGALAARVWLPWFPIAPRVVAIPIYALGLLPWAVAYAAAVQERRGLKGAGWWVVVSAMLMLTLGAAASSVASLGFLVVVLPLLPAILALTQVVTAPVQRPWAAGIATAAFLGWLLAVLFPLG